MKTKKIKKSTILYDITPCSPLKINRRFGGTYHLHFQSRRISQARNQREGRWQADQSARLDYDVWVEESVTRSTLASPLVLLLLYDTTASLAGQSSCRNSCYTGNGKEMEASKSVPGWLARRTEWNLQHPLAFSQQPSEPIGDKNRVSGWPLKWGGFGGLGKELEKL
jgi:hypothetical protein